MTDQTAQRTVVWLRGELDATNFGSLRQVLDGLLLGGARDIEVEMSRLTFVDHAGLAVLLSAHRRLAEQGHSLALVAPPRIVRRLLAVTGVDTMLPIIE